MRRAVALGVMLTLLVAGTAYGGGRLSGVLGDFAYPASGGTSHVEVVAYGGAEPRGWMAFEGATAAFGGPVTCITVEGSDAWVAGPITYVTYGTVPGPSWSLRLSDHGKADLARTFVHYTDVGGQWYCESASHGSDSDLLRVTEGYLIVR